MDIEVGGGKTLPIFVNHLKSMLGGRAKTAPRRLLQAKEVVKILKARFGSKLKTAKFVVLGDMNDYIEEPNPSKAITTLMKDAYLENVADRLPKGKRWTHFWSKKKEYRQLDYLLISKGLANANKTVKPKIERRGMPKRASQFTGKRFKGVGQNNPKASDHCPLTITLTV